jgi:hypothetical protein
MTLNSIEYQTALNLITVFVMSPLKAGRLSNLQKAGRLLRPLRGLAMTVKYHLIL